MSSVVAWEQCFRWRPGFNLLRHDCYQHTWTKLRDLPATKQVVDEQRNTNLTMGQPCVVWEFTKLIGTTTIPSLFSWALTYRATELLSSVFLCKRGPDLQKLVTVQSSFALRPPRQWCLLYFDLNCTEKGPDPRTAKREFHAAEARCCFVSCNLVFWLLGKGPDLKLVTVQSSIHCRYHDSGVLETVFWTAWKRDQPQKLPGGISMPPKPDVAFAGDLVFWLSSPPSLGLTMSLAQVNHICIYLYIMFRHSLSAHSSSAHSFLAQILSAYFP